MNGASTAPRSTANGWSKEALFSLIGVLVMVIISSLGFLWKCILMKGRWRKKPRVCQDVEHGNSNDHTNPIYSFTTWEHQDLKLIRKQQQEAYTASVRIRRC
ncbi:hypothetical protein K469DRAFT_2933 [Zopfia rhizophila CBS 207.26]|uniref:Uncharacterized protein n=1 Tax=Zopfia rhizophila CBS 207.26 TaxID=1314779 RepID=A0A6A6EV47_9PEZI|nr:hypothetical protein K469DRAFT_2933 [Zopfia rhizophila CBS 207.26]